MHLKIWHKMIIGIAIPSFIALMGGILTYGYINDVRNREKIVEIADDLKEQVLEVRRNEKNFFHYKNGEHFNNLQEAISVFFDLVNNISPDTAENIGKEDILTLIDLIQRYRTLTADLYKNYQDETLMTEKVRTEGRKLEEFAAEGKHAEELSTSFILNLRRLEKNYMLFRDRASLIELNRGISQMKNMTPFCVECISYIKAIRNLFNTYERSESLIKNLQITGDKLEKITDTITNRERQKISSFLRQTQYLLLAVLALLIIMGPLFVYKTANYIVTPIKRLAEITRKISEGDLNLRAPLKEHDETYTLAVSFNKMLDHLQLTHKSLEKSLDLLREKQAQLVESEKRASLGLLVSGVAHELNNPLNNISLIAERIKEERADLAKGELKGLEDILSQCERAKHIVENLLDFARARKSTEMERQDIVRVVKDSFTLVANQLRITNIDLVQNIPDKEIFVNGNRSKLEQILVSIYTNAIQAMKTEGTLTVSIEEDTEGKNVLIKISDTGPGIPEEDISKIFEPFFTTKPVGEGTGLGLSVSRSLVQEHKGEIEVESKLGKGTTFIITLPLYEKSERS
jgi:signal transduction histidine kinase